MKAVYTITRAVSESVDLAIESATAEGCCLTVTVSGSSLKDDFFNSGCSANASLKISDGNNDLTTAYVGMVPMKNITFSDVNFKDYCVRNFDADGDGEISPYEAWFVTRIECGNRGLTSLAGIEYFSNLEYLDVSANSWLHTINLYKNTALETLDASSTAVSRIARLEQSIALKTLNLNSCSSLTSLDLSGNTLLTTLDVSGTGLSSLDISDNSLLGSLYYTEGLTITTGFSIGRYIKLNGVPGVAFYVSGTVAKIVSVEEKKSVTGPKGVDWCQKTLVWPVPTNEELQMIYNNKETLNSTLSALGAPQFSSSYYWSAEKDYGDDRYALNFGNGSLDYFNQWNSYCNVRAVRTL